VFFESLKKAKQESDQRVVNSLYHKAVGYEQDAVKIFQFQGEPVIVPYKEIIAPDTTAQIFWLKNRQPQQWRDKQEVEHSGKIKAEVSDDELDARIQELERIAKKGIY
jgi:hypothetical protein